jgi:hypothetical protein
MAGMRRKAMEHILLPLEGRGSGWGSSAAGTAASAFASHDPRPASPFQGEEYTPYFSIRP